MLESMNSNFSELVEKLKNYEITVQDFVARIKRCDDYSNSLLEEIKLQTAREDWSLLTKLIWAVAFVPSAKFAAPLCYLLDTHRYDGYMEAIVDALYDVKDEKSIPSLKKALNHYEAGDDDFHFNRKVLYALERIETAEAYGVIETALENENELIREAAREILEQKSPENS